MAINPIAKDILIRTAESEERIQSLIDRLRGYNENDMYSFLTVTGFQGEDFGGADSGLAGKAFIYMSSSDDYQNTGDKYGWLAMVRLLNCNIQNKDSNLIFSIEEFRNWQVSFGSNALETRTTADALRWFFENFLFNSDPTKLAMETAKKIIIERLEIWKSYIGEDGITDEELSSLEQAEIVRTSEKDAELDSDHTPSELTQEYKTQFITLLKKVYNKDETDGLGNPTQIDNQFFLKVRGDITALPNNEQIKAATFRVVTINSSDIISIDDASIKSVYSKLESTGLLYLASYAYEIGNFAKKRLQSVATAKRSMDEYIQPEIDTPWLNMLSQVVYNLQKDPISFSIINYYFPGLVTFVFDALAAVGDYSNDGKGGGQEDTLNNEADAIRSLESAFGVNASGEPIFTLAFKIDNTAQRIKKAIEQFPFRENIPPRKPDIFHLRLGAANFYVPPVSISVNSAFKTGSLTGGAIRQKNTPKFNAGYKETTISMRLFFPNYEEIWGLDIDDAANIHLDQSFTIDFKNGGDDEAKIDRFLSSLRGLVAAFKYSPIIPIKNAYLNSVHGITAVGLSSMSVSTVPNYPFALVVDLEMLHYNHKPFLPMLKDFNQAIHWGKYRQYMGKAAGEMHRYVNESFLLKTSDNKINDQVNKEDTGLAVTSDGMYKISPYGAMTTTQSEVVNSDLGSESVYAFNTYDNDVLSTNIISQWRDGSNITLFVPAETQTKIFLPDNQSFRSENEKILNDTATGLWDKILSQFGIETTVNTPLIKDINDVSSIALNSTFPKSIRNFVRQAIDVLTAGISTNDSRKKVYLYFVESFIAENTGRLDNEQKYWLRDYKSPEEQYLDTGYYEQYPGTGEESFNINGEVSKDGEKNRNLNQIKKLLDERSAQSGSILETLIDGEVDRQKKSTGLDPDEDKIREQITNAFQVSVYERFFTDGFVKNLMEAQRLRSGDYHFNEWEVPMMRVDLDPKNAVVNGVNVSMGNNLAKLQVQMQDEPTYQYIGGKDTYINISMTVFGEKELLKIKSVFDHANALARLEHSTGVIGFLGIKNIITALSGVKYVLPLNYKVDTMPNYPHVYSVQLSFVDFDIFQQKREKISSEQQKELVEHFGTKRNPFLRIKQLWGAFNAYPDLPLEVKLDGRVVGTLDPDFYFRSFEMFDKDIINNTSIQMDLTQEFTFDSSDEWARNGGGADSLDLRIESLKNRIREFMRRYSYSYVANQTAIETRQQTNEDLINELIDYVNSTGISVHNFVSIFQRVIKEPDSDTINDNSKYALLTDYITLASQSTEDDPFFEEINGSPFKVGNLGMTSADAENLIKQVLSNSHLEGEEEVSFHPDEVEFHKVIHYIPATNPEKEKDNEIPAIMYSALGTHFGYVNKDNGRFYLTIDGVNVIIDSDGSKKIASNHTVDTQTPDRGCTKSLTGISGSQALSEYQKAYDGSFSNHTEKMLNDVQYRDISGRMLRAFPTYMLWLIDEGGMFAGVKLFDNFYGLQSVIDFSVVSSEDLLGDTLILRVSDMYSKLTTRPSTDIFNTNNDDVNADPLSYTDGISAILDRTLNVARNIVSGMRNDYIVDINNIRLKPGVRVHLRGGYGSNPNSLQTLFNGVITNVEQGEIVTITAQSDAIELGAMVNSTNKKGDTGKIDGGVDTGMYLSEPRDLMVRLLSMGASRVKEAIARATLGTVFSENRFGIRHFGTMLYEPLNEVEKARADGLRNVVTSVYSNLGEGKVGSAANSATFKLSTNVFTRNPVQTFFGDGRVMTSMGQLMSNFCSEVDLELFKRNIYPGNGTGFAQFLGGDLDDGWSTVSSLREDDGKRLAGQAYLESGTDRSWNRLIVDAQNSSVGSKNTIDSLTEDNKLVSAEGRAGAVKNVLMGAATVGAAALPFVSGPLAIAGGAGLMGVLSGRGGTNLFRTMGILSQNADDDLPGFDEVSFRAQTYMRTVWDLFQMCAKLLPNYIVAVRPFEDRSTIFYGKPHWLYTSGVVPVTTGFPSVKKANELNLPGYPKYRKPDEDLQMIMDNVNKQSNSLADYEAFSRSSELSDSFSALTNDETNSSGVYAPTSALQGKLINFSSQLALESMSTDIDGKETIVKVPTNIGKVKMGFHLPVGDPSKTSAPLARAEDHRQIDNLPVRFKYPFYTISESTVLDKKSYEVLDGGLFDKYYNRALVQSEMQHLVLNNDKLQEFYDKSVNNADKSQIQGGATLSLNIIYLMQLEAQMLEESKITMIPSSGVFELDRPLGMSSFVDYVSQNYNLSGSFNLSEQQYVKMPLPAVITSNSDRRFIGLFSAQVQNKDFSFEYEQNAPISYEEWGSPASAEEEQFYIAMKWPYKPQVNSDKSISDFKSKYEIDEFYGDAEAYKKKRVLVFSPLTGRAVVCAPAYFLWGEDDDTTAVVSPDAAWYLGNMISSFVDKIPDELKNNLPSWATLSSTSDEDFGSKVQEGVDWDGGLWSDSVSVVDRLSEFIIPGSTDYRDTTISKIEKQSGIAFKPRAVDCFFAFVPDDTPLGVVSSSVAPVKRFINTTESGNSDAYIIGFGNFIVTDGEALTAKRISYSSNGISNMTPDRIERYIANEGIFSEWEASNATVHEYNFEYGGNVLKSGSDDGYFQSVIDANYEALDKGTLYERLDAEVASTGDKDTNSGRVGFVPVYSSADNVSVQARSFYDENFDPNISVIAGNGRTLNQANDIWDQFRFGYHAYDSVKAIFAKTYGLDPDSSDPFPADFARILGDTTKAPFSNFADNLTQVSGLSDYGTFTNSAVDELAILLGSDFFGSETQYGSNYGSTTSKPQDKIEAVEFIRKNYIDFQSTGIRGDAGIIEYFNSTISRSLDGIRKNFFETGVVDNALAIDIENKNDPAAAIQLSEKIKTPKQLFLLMVGLFRQKLWSTPYGRAWLVLKPDRKRGLITAGGGGEDGQWSFKPVDKVFEAFINPYSRYAKEDSRFLQLLVSTKGEGSNSSTFIGGLNEDVKDFYNTNIGPILGAIGDGLSGLLGMFKLNMMQMGYALSEVGNFSKQAHILNKVLNDSIYYSLGRPGTLLRAVDNPFTREYGEPVIEVRQPFQRLHYLSSFSHIISNQIQENLNNVSTVITAVSDGKNPVTVALDKGAPSERQTETTVETGLYYDNMIGSGFLGVLHPLMHPLETFRGVAKTAQGTPDELSARRVALAHLKESIKDIYGGELTIIGNGDIRPHDLVYLSDVYNRMYGMFEVEQVVHHFTPEMGFVTSITPNALVTVNDPSRWFLSSWIHSWFSLQNIRNDTRFYLDNITASNTGVSAGGNISIDALADALGTQMVGAVQYTHGSSALMKDIMANQTALSLPEKAEEMIRSKGQGKASGADTAFALIGAGIAQSFPIVGQLAWKGWKWLRDNVLDQHGCYVQYLNKNGQPMDAGLSYNQGMVVGQYHSKALLPGLLGARTKVKTAEGNVFIRSDDLLKSLGWQETEIKDLVRYTDYENALTHARVLTLSGLGPDKADLQPALFKVLCKVTNFVDGDTFDVQDIISGANFRVRFDGMDTGETNTMKAGLIPNEPGTDINNPYGDTTTITSTSTPGGRAKIYTMNKLTNRLFVLRVKVSNSVAKDVIFEAQFEPGAAENRLENYTKESYIGVEGDRVMGTVWYYQPESVINQAKLFVDGCFVNNKGNTTNAIEKIHTQFFSSVYIESPLYINRDKIITAAKRLIDPAQENTLFEPPYNLIENTLEDYGISNINEIRENYDALVQFKILEATYEKVSEWPTIFWDEYYEDGYPVTLNWELVVNNLAKVYTKQLQTESQSVISAEESALMPRQIVSEN